MSGSPLIYRLSIKIYRPQFRPGSMECYCWWLKLRDFAISDFFCLFRVSSLQYLVLKMYNCTARMSTVSFSQRERETYNCSRSTCASVCK
mmetsp:Transcript_42391/g.83292  ORF Transcript_42391/g.83292 Transcript_42391/m.83292 type:complete len:90 (+) Transcript_42391:1460-1729(+)